MRKAILAIATAIAPEPIFTIPDFGDPFLKPAIFEGFLPSHPLRRRGWSGSEILLSLHSSLLAGAFIWRPVVFLVAGNVCHDCVASEEDCANRDFRGCHYRTANGGGVHIGGIES